MVGLIYKITNNINDKVYIGQTWRDLDIRFNEHKRRADNSLKLKNAFNKYDRKNFNIECLTVCYIQETLDFYETLFIRKYDSVNSGYNIKKGGNGGGFHSENTKRKISKALKGKYMGKNSYRYGKKMSNSIKYKISKAKKGKRCSPDTEFKKGHKISKKIREKMSVSKMGSKNYFYGKTHSQNIKDKISKALIGKYKGEKSPHAKINQQIADKIRDQYSSGAAARCLMSEFKLSKTQIYAIIRNERWPAVKVD